MTDRSYTVEEIEALRGCCRGKLRFGSYASVFEPGHVVFVDDIRLYPALSTEARIEAEEMVRTHMLAGHTAADLIESEEE